MCVCVCVCVCGTYPHRFRVLRSRGKGSLFRGLLGLEGAAIENEVCTVEIVGKL